MAAPKPVPWPASAKIIPSIKHKSKQAITIPGAEITLLKWEDGPEEITIRVYCDKAPHCCKCDCEQDHIIPVSPHSAARIRALLHEVYEENE